MPNTEEQLAISMEAYNLTLLVCLIYEINVLCCAIILVDRQNHLSSLTQSKKRKF